MNYKSLIAILALSFSVSAFSSDIVLSPINFTIQMVRTAIQTTLVPFVSTSAVIESSDRAKLQAIKNDSLDFLSGDGPQML